MLYRVLIIDSAGNLISSYRVGEIEVRFKDESLMSGFIAALLQFGEEIFARPQRIDLDGYALSFYKFSIDTKYYYVVVLTDSTDNPNATKKLVLKLVQELETYIKEAATSDIFIVDERIESEIRSRVEKIAREYLRFMASYRSGGIKSILIATIAGMGVYLLVSMIAFGIPYLLGFTGGEGMAGLSTFVAPVFILGASVGISAGITAGKPHEGAISGWLAYSIPTIALFFIEWIYIWSLSIALSILVFNLIGISTFSLTFGYIFGLWEDERKLTVSQASNK